MLTRDLADEFIRYRTYMVVSGYTIDAYEWALGRLVKAVPELPCTEEALLKALGPPNLALESRRSLRRALDTFFGWVEPRYGIPNLCKDLPKPAGKEAVRRVLTQGELDQLVATANPRDRVQVALVMDTGMRVGELGNLTPQEVGPEWITVHGKSGARHIPISPDVRDAVLDLVVDGVIWRGRRGPLTLEGLKCNMRKLFVRADIGGSKNGFHCLRHTYATWFLRDGGRVPQLQRILGHRNLETTMRYAHLAGEDILDAQREHSPTVRMNLLGTAPAPAEGLARDVAQAYLRGLEEGQQQAHVALRALDTSGHRAGCRCDGCFTVSVILARYGMAA